MAGRPDFRRVILSLGPGAVDRRMLRAAADFARLLELEMVGVFVEDQAMLGLGGLPFVRELRLPGQAWNSFDPARVSDELRAAAQQAKKLFDEEGAARGMTCRVEVRRGDPATLVSGLGEVTDILVVCEPAEAAGWLSPALSRARQAAWKSPASVLIMPPSGISRAGPVAAMAFDATETAIPLASRIAKAAGEEAVIVRTADRSARGLAASLDRALGLRRERMTVMSRGLDESSAELAMGLVALRSAPVLLIEPAAESPGKSRRG